MLCISFSETYLSKTCPTKMLGKYITIHRVHVMYSLLGGDRAFSGCSHSESLCSKTVILR